MQGLKTVRTFRAEGILVDEFNRQQVPFRKIKSVFEIDGGGSDCRLQNGFFLVLDANLPHKCGFF